ncbi:hypothetical protein MRX96_036248 [Rhipicephalus microplus]
MSTHRRLWSISHLVEQWCNAGFEAFPWPVLRRSCHRRVQRIGSRLRRRTQAFSRSPVSFGGQGVRSPVFGQDGIGSPYYDRERSEAPKYEFVAESKSDPRYAMISFESSEKSTSTNTYSATYLLSDADPLPESTEYALNAFTSP